METALDDQLDVSVEDLLSAIWHEGGDDDDGGFITVQELVERCGLCENTVRNRLRGLASLGSLEYRRVYRVSVLGGQRYQTNAYRLRRESL